MTQNETLRVIARRDAQIEALERMLKRKDYLAVGLAVTVCVGPMDSEHAQPVSFELGITALDLPTNLLTAGLEGVKASRAWYAQRAVEEYNELVAFVCKLNDERQRAKARGET